MMFSDLPANMKFICWVFSSKRVTSILLSRSSKPLMTAFEMVPPLVLKVSSTLSFLRMTGWLVPLRAEKKMAVESSVISASACALRSASLAFCCLTALSLMAAAILSCFRAASISSAEGWLYQLNPINTKAMSTNPIMVSLFIVYSFMFCLIYIFTQ